LYNGFAFGVLKVRRVGETRMKKKKIPRSLKRTLQGLPLAGAAITAILPQQRLGQQFIMLIVFLWIQVFFITEVLLAGR
jgi:hypothetical protein